MFEVLVVEDTEEYRRIVTRSLSHCAVTCASDADEAWNVLGRRSFDLIVLDLGLPTRDGQSLLQDLHDDAVLSKIPVICVTGRAGLQDKIAAFSLGVEDYVVKPFDPLEFRARVDSKITRNRIRRDGRVSRVGPIEVDLTQTEFKILKQLISNPDRVFSRDQLLVAAWGADAKVLDRVVDTHVCALRKKLGRHGKSIKSVPSVGYKFATALASKESA